VLHYYDHTYVSPDERFPRRAETIDPKERDVCQHPYDSGDGAPFQSIGEIFSPEHNPGRKRPFEIRRVMRAVMDQDHRPLERWIAMQDAEVAVAWEAHLGGYPVSLLGLESRPVPRAGLVPADGPEAWTAGTLFPKSSKKVARVINAASGNRPLVVLANLSGFDGSPESLRKLQLEFGAEIGRAVTNFDGPIVFVVVSRYHGGAFVVFSKTLNEHMEIAAVEGSYASVIGGTPAAAVVFARVVRKRTHDDPRVVAARAAVEEAAGDEVAARREELAATIESVHSEKVGEMAAEFDGIHTIERAERVGSVDEIIAAADVRPWIIGALERGMANVRGDDSAAAAGR
jgi:acetyl-CoA carboxylase carboxyltransferase component